MQARAPVASGRAEQEPVEVGRAAPVGNDSETCNRNCVKRDVIALTSNMTPAAIVPPVQFVTLSQKFTCRFDGGRVHLGKVYGGSKTDVQGQGVDRNGHANYTDVSQTFD